MAKIFQKSPKVLRRKFLASTGAALVGLTATKSVADIAQSGAGQGAALIKTKAALTGAVERSVFDKLSDEVSLKDFGAVGDGTTDDRAALAMADAAGDFTIPAGTYKISSEITISNTMTFKKGAILAPDAAVTITISGGVSAGNYQIFGTDGDIALSKVHMVDVIPITWFGALPADLDTDMSDQSLADNNMLAIRKAVAMSDNGIPAGIYRTPTVFIPTGLFIVDDDDSDGIGVKVPSYATILGHGNSSVIRPKDSAKTMDIFAITDDGAGNILIDNFHIYGEASTQKNAQQAISIKPPRGAVVYSTIGKDIFIKEMSGNGIKVVGKGLENSTIAAKIVRDCTLHNLLVTACDRLTLRDGIYRTAKSGNSGAVFDGVGCKSARISNCQFDENNAHGLLISNIAGRFEFDNIRAQSNFTGCGVYLDRCDNALITGIFSEANAKQGIVFDGCDYVSAMGLYARSNGQHGIYVGGSNNCNFNAPYSIGNGQETDDTYAGIYIGSASGDNNIQAATVRHAGGANQHKYGIWIDGRTCRANLVTNNDLKNSGRTANLFDDGSGTVTTTGNRV